MAYCMAELMLQETIIIGKNLIGQMIVSILSAIIIYTGMLNIFNTYKNITRYENGNDYLVYIIACLSAYIIISILKIFFTNEIVSQRVNLISALLIVVAIISYRVILRLILNKSYKNYGTHKEDVRKNVLIIGAGDATRIVLGTLKTTFRDIYNVVGLIDDNPNKVIMQYQVIVYLEQEMIYQKYVKKTM